MPCHTTLGVPVDWKYMKLNSSTPSYVYSNFIVYDSFEGKISTKSMDPATGYYNLTIHNVQLNDSGWYVCIEDGGSGDKHVYVLNISGSLTYLSVVNTVIITFIC